MINWMDRYGKLLPFIAFLGTFLAFILAHAW